MPGLGRPAEEAELTEEARGEYERERRRAHNDALPRAHEWARPRRPLRASEIPFSGDLPRDQPHRVPTRSSEYLDLLI